LDDAVKLLNAVGAVPLPIGMFAQDIRFTRKIRDPHADERAWG
jgi:hypothetical protein